MCWHFCFLLRTNFRPVFNLQKELPNIILNQSQRVKHFLLSLTNQYQFLWRTITVISFPKLIVRGVDFVWWVQCLDCIFSAGWGWSDPNPVVDCVLSYTLCVTILMNILHCTAPTHTTPGNISDSVEVMQYYITSILSENWWFIEYIRFNIGFRKCNNIALWHPSKKNIIIFMT